MDNFFDDLGRFLRSIFDDPNPKPSSDPYMQEAMEELEDYLRDGEGSAYGRTSGTNTDWKKQYFHRSEADKELESLKTDFANLHVPLGAPLTQVKKAYKKELSLYHPDKHADNQEKLKIATEITKKINASYSKIKAFYQKYPNYNRK